MASATIITGMASRVASIIRGMDPSDLNFRRDTETGVFAKQHSMSGTPASNPREEREIAEFAGDRIC